MRDYVDRYKGFVLDAERDRNGWHVRIVSNRHRVLLMTESEYEDLQELMKHFNDFLSRNHKAAS